MSVLRDIRDQVETLAWQKLQVEMARTVPSAEAPPRANSLLRVESAFVAVELRVLSRLVDEAQIELSARLHRSFVAVLTRLARTRRGWIGALDGERALLVFETAPSEPSKPVASATAAALHLVYCFSTVLRPAFKTLTFDIGVGIVAGAGYAVGGSGGGSVPMVWLGPGPSLAARLAAEAGNPYNVWANEDVYGCLPRELRYTTYTNVQGVAQDLAMWESTSVEYLLARQSAIKTRYQVKLR